MRPPRFREPFPEWGNGQEPFWFARGLEHPGNALGLFGLVVGIPFLIVAAVTSPTGTVSGHGWVVGVTCDVLLFGWLAALVVTIGLAVAWECMMAVGWSLTRRRVRTGELSEEEHYLGYATRAFVEDRIGQGEYEELCERILRGERPSALAGEVVPLRLTTVYE